MKTIINTPKFEIGIKPDKMKGYFEHHELGDEYAGGLWFETGEDGRQELIDYDGVYEVPMEVIQALEVAGFNMKWAK